MAPKKSKRGGVFIGPAPPTYASETAARLDQLAIENSKKPGESEVDDDIMDTVNTADTCTYVSFARGNSFGLLTNQSLKNLSKMNVPNLDPHTRQPLDPLIIQRGIYAPTRTYQGSNATCATFSPNNKFVIAGTLEGQLHVWKTANGTAMRLQNPEDLNEEHARVSVRKVWCDSQSPNTVFVGRINGVVEEWQIYEFRFLRTVSQPVLPSMFAYDFCYDGQYAVGEQFDIASPTRGLMVVSNTNGATHTIKAHDGMMFDAKYSPNGMQIATTGHDRAVKLWNAETQQLIHEFEGIRRIGYTVMFSPNNTQLAMGCADGAVYLWQLQPRHLLHKLRDDLKPKTAKTTLAFTPDGRLLVIGSHHSNVVEFWYTRTGIFAGVCTLAPGASPNHIAVAKENPNVNVYSMLIICNHGFVHYFKFK